MFFAPSFLEDKIDKRKRKRKREREMSGKGVEDE
jgi:hypothetical protein